ncbi:MAG: hypothetical protein J6V25_07945 [Oscillospiraceae bacterium]|nr:hypothetical protein [Oscillospiraceae bacterium]
MTLQQFEANLKAAFADTYETAAPKGKQRFVVWHRYGRSSVFGDDRNQLDAPKVQIDIVTNVHDDTLVDDICAALWMMDLTYTVESEGYDDDYAAYRTILQLVVI